VRSRGKTAQSELQPAKSIYTAGEIGASCLGARMLERAAVGQGRTKSKGLRARRRFGAAFGLALTVSLLGLSPAQAQSCGPLPLGTPFDFRSVVSSGLAAGAALSASITAADVAFLSQSTAFVGAPANPQPGQEGAGVWVRGVGGGETLKSNSTVSATGTALSFPGGTQTGITTCFTKFKETYGGVQVGQDIATLNVAGGWNVHLGTTAGAIGAHGEIDGGSPIGGLAGVPVTQTPFDTTSKSPFVGTYVAVTKESFFFDALFRYNVYDTILDSPGSNFFSQTNNAHGFTLSSSIGYNYHVPSSNWFVEPSAGIIWSRTTVNALNVNSPAFGPGQGFSGSVQINDIKSVIGRLGLRVGTTFEAGGIAWQPFAAASVWHDFSGETTSSFTSCTGCFFFPNAGSVVASTATTNFGTFGQYSLGVSGQIINTGWLGFARVDFRSGPNLDGVSATGGIRYQFTPEARAPMVVKAMPTKAPPAASAPIAWTGWYIGAYGGAEIGHAELNSSNVASADMRPGGILVGGTLGYNYQLAQYVIGVEGDGGWTNASGSASCSGPLNGFGGTNNVFFQTTCHEDAKWIATLAARAGYLLTDRTLLYLKGGAAWERQSWSATCNLGPFNGQIFPFQTCQNPALAFPPLNGPVTANETRTGGLIGFGTEFAFNRNWSAKAEWDWIGFGSKTLTASDGTVFGTKQSISQVKVGLNYHFN
jgi:outer membrane autotransporter protein